MIRRVAFFQGFVPFISQKTNQIYIPNLIIQQSPLLFHFNILIILQHVFSKYLNVSSKGQKLIAITKNLFCNGYMYGSINTLEN